MSNIEKKIIYNPESKENLNDRRVFGGDPDGMINFTRCKYEWALKLWDMMEANTWFPREVQMTGDAKDYKYLTEPEKRMYDLVLSQLIFMDSCFPEDTEVLTENGWELISGIDKNTFIAQYDTNSNDISFALPLKRISHHWEGDMITFCNEYGNIFHKSTEDHDILVADRYINDDLTISKIKAKDLKVRSQRNFIRSGFKNNGEISVLTAHQKLLIALQADGWIGYKSKNHTTIYFEFIKDYKKDYLIELLNNLNYEWKKNIYFTNNSISKEKTRFTIKIPNTEIVSKIFDWIPSIKYLTTEFATNFINELIKWDHYENNGQHVYSTTIKENINLVQQLFTISNITHNLRYYDNCYSLTWRYISNNLYNTGLKNTSGVIKLTESFSGEVYCFSMPKGTLIIRQQNQVQITGNCQVNNLMDNINPYITAPEINACLSRQSYEEANHSKSYAVMVESISDNTDMIYDMWKNDPRLREKNSFIAEVYTNLSKHITDEKIVLAMFANQILEGIYFYSGFAAIYALGKSGKMLGSSQMIRFIQRDEVTHLLMFQNMINSVRKERPDLFTSELEEQVRDMFRKAVDLEASWGEYITQGQILGFTDKIIRQYIEYLADQRLEAVGYKAMYNSKHPIPWVDGYASFNDQRTNFFEGNVVNYSKGSLDFDDF